MWNNWLLAAAVSSGAVASAPASAVAGGLATVAAESGTAANVASFDGVVEAVRQTVVAAQVAGAVVALEVKVGDAVKPGQVLVRIDARGAEQNTLSSDAQVRSARAALEVAAKEFERQKQLFDKRYVSQAALERAEAQFKATQAAVSAQVAQAGATRTQSGFFIVRAPYAGVVAEVPVSLGEMAMPGRPLLSLYDPGMLRVTVAVPQSVAAMVGTNDKIKLELPGLPGLPAARQWLEPVRTTVLPTADAATHSVQLRFELPMASGASPGMFARAWLPMPAGSGERVLIPSNAVVRRAELNAVYVVDATGRPWLRLVRLGRPVGDRVEILSGLAVAERVAIDPQAAARLP